MEGGDLGVGAWVFVSVMFFLLDWLRTPSVTSTPCPRQKREKANENRSNVLSFRPKTKHESIEGCYFVGASAHPGTGCVPSLPLLPHFSSSPHKLTTTPNSVPIVLAGAKLAATRILKDLGLAVPWKEWAPERGSDPSLKLAGKRWGWEGGWGGLVVLAIIVVVLAVWWRV